MGRLLLDRRSFLASYPLARLRAADGPKRNVLFIVSDDLCASLGCYGNSVVKTPNLDGLARRGVVFDSAFCQYPLCQPSRTSFLSGRRPETTRVFTLQTRTREHLGDAVFLPEHFRRNGYFTAMSGKVYHTGNCCEDPRSWSEEHREFGKNPKPAEIVRSGSAAGPLGHSFNWSVLNTADEDTPDGIAARRAAAIMERLSSKGQSFFLGVGFRRPHAPYAAPKKYFDLYDPKNISPPKTPASHFGKLVPAAVNHDPPEEPLSDRATREYLAAYYASVSFMDAQAGVLLDTLDRLRLWDSTTVVFLGDHGYHLGDHGGLWHKNTLFDQGLRVPLIVAAPDAKGNGKRSSRLVELVDLYPTLAALSGLPRPEGLEGTNFAPLLDDPSRPWKKAAFSMQGRGPERAEAAKEIVYMGRSVRTERYRYTEWDEGRQGTELYDHSSDPGELNNLASKPSTFAIRVELKSLLRAGWRAARPAA